MLYKHQKSSLDSQISVIKERISKVKAGNALKRAERECEMSGRGGEVRAVMKRCGSDVVGHARETLKTAPHRSGSELYLHNNTSS